MKNVSNKSDPVQVLVQIMSEVGKVSNDIRVQFSQLDSQTKATLGHKLWSISRKVTLDLELIKHYLRDEAIRHQQGAPGTVKFFTSDGSACSVSIQRTSLEVQKNADMDSIRKMLGPRFDCFFRTTVTYKLREDFNERIKELDPAEQQALLGIINVVPNTPKVFFED